MNDVNTDLFFRTSLTFILNASLCYRLMCLTQQARTLNRFTIVMFIFSYNKVLFAANEHGCV